jgi:hypothetical protein
MLTGSMFSTLTKLETLYIGKLGVTDSDLSHLPLLTYLCMYESVDITPTGLLNLKKLKVVNFDDNRIAKCKPIKAYIRTRPEIVMTTQAFNHYVWK